MKQNHTVNQVLAITRQAFRNGQKPLALNSIARLPARRPVFDSRHGLSLRQHCVQTGSGAFPPPANLLPGGGGAIPPAVKLTSHPHLASMSRKNA